MAYRIFGIVLVVLNIGSLLFSITTGNWLFAILNAVCAFVVMFILLDEWDEHA